MKQDKSNTSELILYQTEDGKTKLEVRLQDETVWLSQKQMAELFDCSIDNIAKEIEYNVKRLRHHPCLALWCGNNEIEVAWGNWGWQSQYGYSKKDEAEIWNNYQAIFHHLIPQLLEKLDPEIPYVPTTPLSNWGKPENFNHSSMHYWGVWHGKEPIENFELNVGRFIAEYGYQSFPSVNTLARVLDTADLNLQSEISYCSRSGMNLMN